MTAMTARQTIERLMSNGLLLLAADGVAVDDGPCVVMPLEMALLTAAVFKAARHLLCYDQATTGAREKALDLQLALDRLSCYKSPAVTTGSPVSVAAFCDTMAGRRPAPAPSTEERAAIGDAGDPR
jgi:hypothetical protein